MALILYAIAPSLYSAKTRIALRAKGISWEEQHPEGAYNNPEFQAQFPVSTLPAIDDNGFRLSDSEAINEYLNETQPYPNLLPDGARARAKARMLSRFHDTRFEPNVRALFGHVKPANRDQNHVGVQVDLINQRLGQFSLLIERAPLLTGENLSLADCGFPITFAFLTIMMEPMGLNIIWPQNVAAYAHALKAHPVVAAELDSYTPAVEAWVASQLA